MHHMTSASLSAYLICSQSLIQFPWSFFFFSFPYYKLDMGFLSRHSSAYAYTKKPKKGSADRGSQKKEGPKNVSGSANVLANDGAAGSDTGAGPSKGDVNTRREFYFILFCSCRFALSKTNGVASCLCCPCAWKVYAADWLWYGSGLTRQRVGSQSAGKVGSRSRCQGTLYLSFFLYPN